MFLLILLYSESYSERAFIGFLTASFISLIVWLYNRSKQKRASEEATKQVQQNIVKEANENVFSNYNLNIDYSSIYKELKEKCNPSNYMNPYDAKKVEISNSIYSQLEINKNNITVLIELRNKAIKELEIHFSAKELYDKLSLIFNPSNFMNENYDAVKLYAANKIYSQIQQCKDDIIKLERIATENKIDLLSTYNNADNHSINQDKTIEKDKTSDNGDDFITNICIALFIFLCLAVIIYTYKLNSESSTEDIDDNQINKELLVNRNYFWGFSTKDLTLKYPSSWEIVQQDANVGTHTTINVMLMEKKKNDNDFQANINIIKSKTKWEEPTSYLVEMSNKQLIDSDIECTLISIDDCILGGCKGSVSKRISTLNGYRLIEYQYVVKKQDNTTFIISVAVDSINNESKEKTIKEILNSIVFK